MKKIVVSIVLVVMLLGFGIANAQVSQQIPKVNQVQIDEIIKRIDLLNKILYLLRQIESLKAQIAALQAIQTPIVSPLSTPMVQIVNQPIFVASSTQQILATSTTVVSPTLQYTPTIKLEIVGTKVIWQASGERFNCKLNGESVWQEGSRETDITLYALVCVGTVTGIKLEKTIR